MNTVLWVLQTVLALVFAAHGWLLLFPPAAVAEQMDASLPGWFQLFLGVAEVAAALGLILPGLTGIKSFLVPLAAAGIVVIMVGATLFHVARSEWSSAGITFVLLLMAMVVALRRGRALPTRS